MIIFDIDGTLADCEHRRHFVDASYTDTGYFRDPVTLTQVKGWYYKGNGVEFQPDWKSFYEACDQDVPIKPTLYLLEDLVLNNTDFEIWSGRCESVREKTIKWLSCHLSLTMRWSNGKWNEYLKTRPIGDSTHDYILKEIWLDEAIQQGKTVDFVFDSDDESIKMWRRRGIFVFNCCQHD